jgi:general stress protein 26
VDDDGHWSWCRTNERVHLKVVPTKDGQPHIGAMTRAGDKDNLYLLSYNDTAVIVNYLCCFTNF